MKNRKLLLLLTAPSLLVVGCTPENSSSSKDSVPSSSSTVVTSSPSKEGSIRNANDLRALVTENMALPTSALRYTYEEKMPNETEAHTIFDTYDVKMTQNENFVRLVQEGKETPIERYAGILDNVYYSTETGTGFDSASRKKIVDEVQSYDQEITLDDAQKNIQNIQNHNGLPFLFSNGEMGSLTGKINFLAAVEEKNTQISFSSVLGSDGKETVHYVSYYEEKSLDLDHPTSYDYDFTLVIENGKISEATLTGMAAATDNWDLDKHEPKEGTGTFMSFHLENVTYVDALPQTGTAPLLSTLPSYFITEIKHASFQDYMTGKDAVIRVGDSYFTSLLKIDSYEPSTALDVSTITITSSSDESVIGKDSYGYGYEALKAGTTDLTLGNVFNPNLYTMKGVTVLPAEPSVTGIKGVESDATVDLEIGESKTFDLELSSYGEKGPWDLSNLSFSGGEGIVSSAFQMTGSSEADYGISVTLTGLSEGSANLSLNGTYYDVSLKVKVTAKDERPTLTIPAVEGVTLTQIEAGNSKHASGEEVSFYADPKTGYAIDTVYLVVGETKTELKPGSQNRYTFTMPNGDCSIEFVIRKIETATISYTKPSYSVASEFKVFYNPEGSTEEKTITSGASVAVGTKVKIKLSLISGKVLKSITVSDGTAVTTVTANKEYSFILGSKDVTLTFDIQADSSTHAINITSGDYAVDTVQADKQYLSYNKRVAKEGQSIEVTLYISNTAKSFSSVSVTDEKGNAVTFTQKATTIADPSFDPEYDHGEPTQLPAVIIAFTMPNSAVTISAIVA